MGTISWTLIQDLRPDTAKLIPAHLLLLLLQLLLMVLLLPLLLLLPILLLLHLFLLLNMLLFLLLFLRLLISFNNCGVAIRYILRICKVTHAHLSSVYYLYSILDTLSFPAP